MNHKYIQIDWNDPMIWDCKDWWPDNTNLLSFTDPSWANRVFKLQNVESGLVMANGNSGGGIYHSNWKTNFSLISTGGSEFYFVKVLNENNEWENVVKIFNNNTVGYESTWTNAWRQLKRGGSYPDELFSDGNLYSNTSADFPFTIEPNNDGTFKILCNATEKYVGVPVNNDIITNPVLITCEDDGNYYINWRLALFVPDLPTRKTVGNKYYKIIRNLWDSKNFKLVGGNAKSFNNNNSYSTSFFLQNIETGLLLDDSPTKSGRMYLGNEGIKIAFAWKDNQNSSVILMGWIRKLYGNMWWAEQILNKYLDSRTLPDGVTLFALNNFDGTFKLKNHGQGSYIGVLDGETVINTVTPNDGINAVNWQIVEPYTDDIFIADSISNPELINIAINENWNLYFTNELFAKDVILTPVITTSPFTSLIHFSELQYCNNIKEIPNNCFKDCTLLEDIVLPSSCKRIALNAFNGCTSLNSVDCQNVEEYVLCNENDWINKFNYTNISTYSKFMAGEDSGLIEGPNKDVLLDSTRTILIVGNKKCIIPQTVTTIKSYAFSNMNVTTLILPKNVTTIQENAFNNCILNKVYAKNKIVPTGTISGNILYVPKGCLSQYQTAWPNFNSYIEFEEKAPIITTRKFIINKEEDDLSWENEYTRLTYVGTSMTSRKITIDLTTSDIGGFDLYNGNFGWGNYNENTIMSSWDPIDLINDIDFRIYYGGSSGHSNRTLNYKGLKSSTGLGTTTLNHMQKMSLKVIDDYNIYFQASKASYKTTTLSTPKAVMNGNQDILLLFQTGNSYSYANNGQRIYEAVFYGRTKEGYWENNVISHLIPVQRKSDDIRGLYDTIRKRFFADVSLLQLDASPAINYGDVLTKANFYKIQNTNARIFDSIATRAYSCEKYINKPGGTFTFSVETIVTNYNMRLVLVPKDGIGNVITSGVGHKQNNCIEIGGAINENNLSISYKLQKEIWDTHPYIIIHAYTSSGNINVDTACAIDWTLTYEYIQE